MSCRHCTNNNDGRTETYHQGGVPAPASIAERNAFEVYARFERVVIQDEVRDVGHVLPGIRLP